MFPRATRALGTDERTLTAYDARARTHTQADGSGKLDLREIKPCLKALEDAAEAVNQEIASIQAIGDSCRRRAEQLRAAALAMRQVCASHGATSLRVCLPSLALRLLGPPWPCACATARRVASTRDQHPCHSHGFI